VLQDIRVDGGDAVDILGGHDGQDGHADVLLAVVRLLDDGELADLLPVVPELGPDRLQEPPVDVIDDLRVPRQQLFEHGDRPLLQRLGQDRVVGKVAHLRDEIPRLGPPQSLEVHEHAHELGNQERRVRVVHLERDLVRERVPVVVALLWWWWWWWWWWRAL
jgi:hypothetical protein